MSKLLKMNLFRLVRTKLGYVMAIISFVLVMLTFVMNFLVYHFLASDLASFLTGMDAEAAGSVFKLLYPMFTDPMIALLSTMFIILFINLELSSGYAKNVIGYEGNKYALSGANIATSAIYTAVLLTVPLIIGTVLTMICYKTTDFSGAGTFAAFIGLAFLEITAFVSLLLALSDLTGKHVLFMILGAVYYIYGPLIYQLINLVINRHREVPFSLGKYTVIGGMLTHGPDSSAKDYIISAAIAAAALILGYFLDVKALKKRELK